MKDILTMIRDFSNDDTDAVVTIWRTASELAHPFLLATFLDEQAIALRDIYLPATKTWVTEIEGKVVGFIAMMDNEIAGLFLDPTHHGRGLGRALVDTARGKHDHLKVEVFEKNRIGCRFYDIYGFEPTGEYEHKETGNTVIQMSI